MSLRDMIKRLWEARKNRVEIPKNEVIIPTKQEGVVLGIDYGTGKDVSGTVIKHGDKTNILQGGLLTPNQSKTFIDKIKLSDKKILAKTKIVQMKPPVRQSPYDTIEEALAHRHVKVPEEESTLADIQGFEKKLMKSLTDQIAADIDDAMLNSGNTDRDDDITLDSISGAIFVPRVLTNIPRMANPSAASKLFKKYNEPTSPYDTIEEALANRHRKLSMVGSIKQPLYASATIKPAIFPRTKFLPLLASNIDNLWSKK
jgi:hypothetical protein